MAKACPNCNRKGFLFVYSIKCQICSKKGCEKCFVFRFKTPETVWKKMHGQKMSTFDYFRTNLFGINLIEECVCSEECALALVDLYLKDYKSSEFIHINIINSMDISIYQTYADDELYFHLNDYLTKGYMKKYSMDFLRIKDRVAIAETQSLYERIKKKLIDKQLNVIEDFVAY